MTGDVFDPAFIAPRPPFDRPPETPCPDLGVLNSLTPLQGRLSAIHASSFFHLFSEEQQLEVAQRLATLLSPTPGSMIFGTHIGLDKRGTRLGRMFCHDPESWKEG
jgi:hypothetical protein